MTIASRLSASNIQRSSDRKLLESMAASTVAGQSVSGIVSKVDSSGTTLTTENGGNITIPPTSDDAEGISPTVGRVYQTSLASGGRAKLQINGRSQSSAPVSQQTGQVFYDTRAPVNGEDFGRVGDIWGHIQGFSGGYDIISFWRWVQPVGRWALTTGGDESNGEIPNPVAGEVITVVSNSGYSSIITGYTIRVGAVTATVNAGTATFVISDVREGSTDTVNDKNLTVNDAASNPNTIYFSKGIGETLVPGEELYMLTHVVSGVPIAWTVKYV